MAERWRKPAATVSIRGQKFRGSAADRWAAQLCSHLRRLDPSDADARQRKATALRNIAVVMVDFADAGVSYGLRVYRGLARFLREAPERVDHRIEVEHAVWAEMVANVTGVRQGWTLVERRCTVISSTCSTTTS